MEIYNSGIVVMTIEEYNEKLGVSVPELTKEERDIVAEALQLFRTYPVEKVIRAKGRINGCDLARRDKVIRRVMAKLNW